MDEELKPCPFCHREAQQTLCSGLVSCAYEDCPAFLLAVFPENWNTRAQLPSQVGEAVEVVAYIDDGGALYTSKLLEIMSVESDGCEPLMTVAQHQRILAASVGSAEPAGWYTEDHLTDKSATTYDREVAERWRAKGWPVTPLYTHPVNSVA